VLVWCTFKSFIKPCRQFLYALPSSVFRLTKSNALTDCRVGYWLSLVLSRNVVPSKLPSTVAPLPPPPQILTNNHQAMLQKRRPRPRTNPQLPLHSPNLLLGNLRHHRLHRPTARPDDARLAPENRAVLPSPRDRAERARRHLALHLPRKHQSPLRSRCRLVAAVRRRARHHREPDAFPAPALPRSGRAARE